MISKRGCAEVQMDGKRDGGGRVEGLLGKETIFVHFEGGDEGLEKIFC